MTKKQDTTKLAITYKAIADLIPYARNSRTHDETQVAQIAASIKEFGWTNPILLDGENGIIAGHGRVLAAQKLGEEQVPTIELGHLSEHQKRAYVIADNKLALNANWDQEMLALEIKDLTDAGFNLGITGFDISEIEAFNLDSSDGPINGDDNPYTDKVDSPTYEPTGEKPLVEELFNDEKAMDLIDSIKDSKLSEKEKQFLMTAASRHIVFDYSKIANFYAHSTKECQELMEKSALVIVDFNKAIENGFIQLTEEISNMFESDENDALTQDE
jgi:hypothetical protein